MYGGDWLRRVRRGIVRADFDDPARTSDLDDLIACHICDTLHRDTDVPEGRRARCVRCGNVLQTPRGGAYTQIVVLALTGLILMVGAVFFPFLDLSTAGLHARGNVIDAITAFSDGLLLPLSFAVAALIVVLPAIRLMAILYTLAPLIAGRPPLRHATAAFRLAERLKPWSMAEIFIVGVAVALVKIADLATVSLGPAFWAFAALVIVTTLKDTFMCRLTIWKTLDARSRP